MAVEIFMTKSSRINVPDMRIDLGTACTQSSIAIDQTKPGFGVRKKELIGQLSSSCYLMVFVWMSFSLVSWIGCINLQCHSNTVLGFPIH